jgi:hypothetical protein
VTAVCASWEDNPTYHIRCYACFGVVEIARVILRMNVSLVITAIFGSWHRERTTAHHRASPLVASIDGLLKRSDGVEWSLQTRPGRVGKIRIGWEIVSIHSIEQKSARLTNGVAIDVEMLRAAERRNGSLFEQLGV